MNMPYMMCIMQLAVMLHSPSSLHSPASGRYMDLSTNMPGLQFYSGNNLNGPWWARVPPCPVYGRMALETQVGSSIWLLWH